MATCHIQSVTFSGRKSHELGHFPGNECGRMCLSGFRSAHDRFGHWLWINVSHQSLHIRPHATADDATLQ